MSQSSIRHLKHCIPPCRAITRGTLEGGGEGKGEKVSRGGREGERRGGKGREGEGKGEKRNLHSVVTSCLSSDTLQLMRNDFPRFSGIIILRRKEGDEKGKGDNKQERRKLRRKQNKKKERNL